MNRCSRPGSEGGVRPASLWIIIPILAVIGGDAEAQSSPEPRWVYGISAGLGGLVREDVVPDDPTMALLAEEGRDLSTLGGEFVMGVVARKVGFLATIGVDMGVGIASEDPVTMRADGQTIALAANERAPASTIVGGAAQYWLTPTLWVRGGVGAATLSRDFTDTNSGVTLSVDHGFTPAVLMGAGMIVPMAGIRPDVQFRYSTYSVGDMRTHSFGIYFGTPLR